MADDRVAAAEFRHHSRGNLAGVRPAGVLADVLRPPGDRRSRQRRLRLPQIRIGNANRQLLAFGSRPPGTQIGQQPVVLPQAAVHFPVADDELAAHCAPERTLARNPSGRAPVQTVGFYPARSAGVNALQRSNAALGTLLPRLVEVARGPPSRRDLRQRRGHLCGSAASRAGSADGSGSPAAAPAARGFRP